MSFFWQSIESPLKKLNAASPSTSKASFAADPLSLIQAKADTFDGLDPLSMFAAQEASSNKVAAVATSASVTTKEKVHVHPCTPVNVEYYDYYYGFGSHLVRLATT